MRFRNIKTGEIRDVMAGGVLPCDAIGDWVDAEPGNELWARNHFRSTVDSFRLLQGSGIPQGLHISWFQRFMDEFVGRIWDACAVLRYGYSVDRGEDA